MAHRFYSKVLERFLTPQEILDRRLLTDLAIPAATSPSGVLADIEVYPATPAVILIHKVDEDRHHESLFLNDKEVFHCIHYPPPSPNHECSEVMAIRLAAALDTKVDERRVHLRELAMANQKAGKPWHILDFSATVEWPDRGGYKK